MTRRPIAAAASRGWIALAMGSVVAACGGAPEPRPPPPAEAPLPEAPPPPPPAVKQELGDIDEDALKRAFASAGDALRACHEQGRARVRGEGGDARVMMRVGEDGRLRYAYFEESTLGDRDTEKCVLDALGAAAWPKPRGGEAEVRHELSLEEGPERAPEWQGEEPARALARSKKTSAEVHKCRAGVAGAFRITAYVKTVVPKPAPRRKAAPVAQLVAVGVVPPGKPGEERADCVAKALRELRLAPTGAPLSKVKFVVP